MRRRVRDEMVRQHLLERMIHDIRWLLAPDEAAAAEPEVVYLWDNKLGTVANAVNYSGKGEEEDP